MPRQQATCSRRVVEESFSNHRLILSLLPTSKTHVFQHLQFLCQGSQGGSFMESGMIQELFDRTVDRHPDNVAITNGCKRVLYHQLRDDANKLANFLIESGASKGSVVAIFIQDPVEVITTIIAALKSGC